jgi:hypothetical protein
MDISRARAHKQPLLFDFNWLSVYGGDGGMPSMEKQSERIIPVSAVIRDVCSISREMLLVSRSSDQH